MSERRLLAVYCDDIRYEIRNKVTHVGIYRQDLLVPKFPTVLPKLCAAVSISTPRALPFEHLRVFVKLGNVVIFDATLDEESLSLPPFDSSNPALQGDSQMVDVGIDLVMSPLAAERESVLQVFAETEVEGELLKSRKLGIRQVPDDETIAQVPTEVRVPRPKPSQ